MRQVGAAEALCLADHSRRSLDRAKKFMELDIARDAAVAWSSLAIPSSGKQIQLSQHWLDRRRQASPTPSHAGGCQRCQSLAPPAGISGFTCR